MLHSSRQDFDQLLAVGASWLLLACGAWAATICAAAALEAVTRGRLRATAWVGCPASLRRTLLAALGVALTGVPAVLGTGNAVTRSSDLPGVARATRQEPMPVPARPLGPAPTHPSRVVVRPGDTLWHLVEVRLPSSAPAQVVANCVSQVHRRNLAVIGADPDLIRPGQSLTLPTLPRAQKPSRARPTP